jgi:pyruvate formate lyase activating enzyme
MEIKGFIDVSLSDWDGRVSSVIFLPGCNFRCPFCYNTKLVLQPETMPTTTILQVEDYLEGNRKWIDGVVITGGEPTTHSDLPSLCQKLKELRFNVKVDTNGTNPAMIRKLVEGRLVDYVALDIKAPLTEQEYSRATGIKAAPLNGRIRDTIQFLLENHVDYEFRTTLVPTLHKTESVDRICQAIKGCRKYVLQNFKSEVDTIDPKFKTFQPFSTAQMEAFLQTAKKTVPDTRLRI